MRTTLLVIDRLAKRRRIKIELWLTNQLSFVDVIEPGDIVPAVWCISVAASWWPVPSVGKDSWEYSHWFQDINLSIPWCCDCVLISCVCFIARHILMSRWTAGGSPVNESRHTLQFSLFICFICFYSGMNIPFCMSTTGLCRPFPFPVTQ